MIGKQSHKWQKAKILEEALVSDTRKRKRGRQNGIQTFHIAKEKNPTNTKAVKENKKQQNTRVFNTQKIWQRSSQIHQI